MHLHIFIHTQFNSQQNVIQQCKLCCIKRSLAEQLQPGELKPGKPDVVERLTSQVAANIELTVDKPCSA